MMVPVGIAAIVQLWGLTSVGFGNAYYSAALRGMSSSWANFLYASFDGGGLVTVDKPPMALWVGVIFVKVLGFTPLGVLLPGALATIGSVVLVSRSVARTWGHLAAAVAGLTLAVTPVAVVIGRSNNLDATLVVLMVSAAVCAVRAAEHGRRGWLVAAALLAGCAVTTKMAAAFPVIPGLFAAYAWRAPISRRRRARDVALAALAFAVSATWWFALVELTPSQSRPYVGSSDHNSVVELAVDRNGVGQLAGTNPSSAGDNPARRTPGGMFGLGFSSGPPHPLRLINYELGTQIGWTVPMTLAAIALAWNTRKQWSIVEAASLVVFGSWFVIGAVGFSLTRGTVHPYYLANIAPPMAVLLGAGVTRVSAQRKSVATLVAGGAATLVLQGRLLSRFDWLDPPRIVVLLVVLAGLAVAVRFRSKLASGAPAAALALTCSAVPMLWTASSIASARDAVLPYAMPVPVPQPYLVDAGRASPGVQPNGGVVFPVGSHDRLVGYLRANRGGERWLVGVESAAAAEEIMITTGEAVAPLGGFRGSDDIVDESQWRGLISTGRLRYFYLPARLTPGSPAVSWLVIERCSAVPANLWQGGITDEDRTADRRGFPSGPVGVAFQLYDCSNRV